jgi:hypothetical protein
MKTTIHVDRQGGGGGGGIESDEVFVTLAQVAERCGVSLRTIDRDIRLGLLEGIEKHPGIRSRRIHVADANRYLRIKRPGCRLFHDLAKE